jgi:hypothetical protein
MQREASTVDDSNICHAALCTRPRILEVDILALAKPVVNRPSYRGFSVRSINMLAR